MVTVEWENQRKVGVSLVLEGIQMLAPSVRLLYSVATRQCFTRGYVFHLFTAQYNNIIVLIGGSLS